MSHVTQLRREHIAVLHEPWLGMLLDGRKTVECRVGARPPRAAAARAGDLLHLRPVGGAPVATMRIERIDDYGYCTRSDLRTLAALYAVELGNPTDLSYLTDRSDGYAIFLWLVRSRTQRPARWPAYQPWFTIRA